MIDLLQKSDKINMADKVCYGNQIKKQYGELSEEKPAFWHTLSALAVLRLFLEVDMAKGVYKRTPDMKTGRYKRVKKEVADKICLQCGKSFSKPAYEGIKTFEKRKYCKLSCCHKNSKGHIAYNKINPRCMPRGKNHHNWKGGRIKHDGYIQILKPNHPFSDKKGYILEHRLIVEKYIRRYLKPKEIVHHDNGIPDDNRIENLCLLSGRSKHMKIHKLGKDRIGISPPNKTPVETITKIVSLRANGFAFKKICRIVKISCPTIKKYCDEEKRRT